MTLESITDIRDTSLYREAEALLSEVRQAGSGKISDAADIHASPDGRVAVFCGQRVEHAPDGPETGIYLIDLATGAVEAVSRGAGTHRLPRFSPDGRTIAFLSDRGRPGDFQLHVFDRASGEVRRGVGVPGWVEDFQWSPDGQNIVLKVAAHGAFVAGVQGAFATSQQVDRPSWIPTVDAGHDPSHSRCAWIYNVAGDCVRKCPCERNVWEVSWCGNDALVAVCSDGSGEGAWFHGTLERVDVSSGESTVVHTPALQIGVAAGAPGGKRVAFVEALCSDRLFVAGDVVVLTPDDGHPQRIWTQDMDVTWLEWRSDSCLLVAGHRGCTSVVGLFDFASATYRDIWVGTDISTGGFYMTVSGIARNGDCVLITEGFHQAPTIAAIRDGVYSVILALDAHYPEKIPYLASVRSIQWLARDGLQIQGWLLCPGTDAPHPLIMSVHGGPVWMTRPTWLGRRGLSFLMLLKRGYAIFLPNPRGSAGRGQCFARMVLGDMGGGDADDLLAGVQHLVDLGLADSHRLGVTGISYGGFMTSWLITQHACFAAAVSLSPHTNFVTYQLASNQPDFVPLFTQDRYTNTSGAFYQRSPIYFADRVRTPVLTICGAHDSCTPPVDALQFHNAVLATGTRSVLVTYPEEGHGIRGYTAMIDCATRVVHWFDKHMRADLAVVPQV